MREAQREQDLRIQFGLRGMPVADLPLVQAPVARLVVYEQGISRAFGARRAEQVDGSLDKVAVRAVLCKGKERHLGAYESPSERLPSKLARCPPLDRLVEASALPLRKVPTSTYRVHPVWHDVAPCLHHCLCDHVECGAEAEIVFSNNVRTILDYTGNVLCCDIHKRFQSKDILIKNGADRVCTLDDILSAPVDGSGYNDKYGLLGSNKSTEDKIKLFPRDCSKLVGVIQDKLLERTGKHIEVMVYGDGAFKDPQGKIWELADPVVSPGYTPGLEGTPNELKLKYLADNDFMHLSGAALNEAIKNRIKEKDKDLVGNMASQGTTPRQITDLLGSLCDLTSGSGDKGTPVVLVQGYFDNFTD